MDHLQYFTIQRSIRMSSAPLHGPQIYKTNFCGSWMDIYCNIVIEHICVEMKVFRQGFIRPTRPFFTQTSFSVSVTSLQTQLLHVWPGVVEVETKCPVADNKKKRDSRQEGFRQEATDFQKPPNFKKSGSWCW